MNTYLFVGLGNPGREYEKTRHNVGFIIIDALRLALENLAQENLPPEIPPPTMSSESSHFHALFSKATLPMHTLFFLKPTTYMNLCGPAVLSCLTFYKIPKDRVVVVHDDLDLVQGCVRLKNGGGSAGHKGVASIIQSIGHDFRRLRIGIGHPPPPLSVTDYVLEPFSPQEKEQWLEPLQHRVKTASLLLAQGEYDRFLGTVCVKVVGDS